MARECRVIQHPDRCMADVSGTWSQNQVQCGNPAKYVGWCGVHSPEKMAERAKVRAAIRKPTFDERLATARREELEGLHTRISELEADGARLDWLEETEASVDARTDGQWEATQWHGTEHHSSVGATVRAAIDAAMSED